MKKIIFFGDSLIAGYGLQHPAKEAVPALIAQHLKDEGMAFEVVNAGLSGDTARSALSRVSSVLHGKLSLFILELGANDFLRGYPAREVKENLQKIISKVTQNYPGTAILLLGIELPLWARDNNNGFGYADVFRELAKTNGIAITPSFLKGIAGNPKLNMADGVHPLAEGYRRAAANIWPDILAILKKLNHTY